MCNPAIPRVKGAIPQAKLHCGKKLAEFKQQFLINMMTIFDPISVDPSFLKDGVKIDNIVRLLHSLK